MNNLPFFSDDIKKMEKNVMYFKWIFLFYFLLNFLIVKCEDYVCKTKNDFSKTECFNNIIKLPLDYRAGRFVTTKNGELIIEYSEDATPGGGRLFYRLNPDGRGYYPGDNPIKQIEISETFATKNEAGVDITCSGRYEARNMLINLVGDSTKKEYLFSTSSWYSFTELYDIESHNYLTWFTSDFFGMPKITNDRYRYIYSYIYSLLNEPDTTNYFIVYIQYVSDNAKSDCYMIKKFSFQREEGSINRTIHTSLQNTDNYDNRAISAVIMEKDKKLVIFYIKNTHKLCIKSYSYSLDEDKEIQIEEDFDVSTGYGNFFEGVYLSDSYTALIYYPKNDQPILLSIKLYQYVSTLDNRFSMKINKQLGIYSLHTYIYNNALFKINENRIILACVNDDKVLYIYLFDFYISYTKILVTKYNFGLSSYSLYKDMALYYYNNLILFTITITDSSNSNNKFSLLMHFGYSNGTDSYIDISHYLSDSDNTDTEQYNIFNYFKSTKVIENNIFDYQEDDKVKLVGFPEELIIKDTNDITLSNGSSITSNPKISQNQALIKTSRNYSIYYQLYVKEPDFDHFKSNSIDTFLFEGENGNNIDPISDDVKDEYASRIHEPLPGRTIKVDFKLCFEYCETCKKLGITKNDQYCITCLESYRFDYFNYFGIYPSNCVPENHFYDNETGNIEECANNNYNYYYNTTDGKRYCFKREYPCPPPYPYLNQTTHECLNYSLPTTIPEIPPTTIPENPTTYIEKVPSTITPIITPSTITPVPKVDTTITVKPEPTVPRERCTYYLLVEGKCDFSKDTNTEVYEKLKNDVVETYPDGGHSAGVEIKDDLYFQLTTNNNQLAVLNGTIQNENNLSIIDLGECANILIRENNLPENTDLIILKLENMTLVSNEKSIQYEVYAPGQSQKLDLSVCSNTKIEIYYPIELDEETKKLYEALKKQGYDLFDKNSKFYKDICTPYKSEDGTDIILADRNNDFFAKHEIVCQSNCDYSSYSSNTNLVKCTCNVVEKERIEAEEPKRVTSKKVDSFIDILKYSNYKVMLCYKLVFRAVTFYKNLGSIFTMIYFIGYLISFGFFLYQGITPFKIEVSKLFRKKRDIRNIKSTNPNIGLEDKNKQKKDIKVNVISNKKLKELIDLEESKKNKRDELNKEKNKNRTIDIFKSNDLIVSNIAMNNNNTNINNNNNNINNDNNIYNNNTINKSSLKRTIKNKKKSVKLIDAIKDPKEKDKLEREKNITYSQEHNKGNIVVKSYLDKAVKTKNSKDNFPPKRRNELNKIEDVKSSNNFKSDDKLDSDIIIHTGKLKNKEISSTEKKSFTKEDLLIKEGTNTNIGLNENKEKVLEQSQETFKFQNKDKNNLTDFELNRLTYFEALKLDDRLFLKVYWSHMKREHPIVYTFMAWNDYNLFFTKLSKFFFELSTIMAFNALFFSNDAMHDIYVTGGSYNLGHHMVQMVLTIIIYQVLGILLNYLTLTDIDYYKIKGKKDTITQKEVIDIINCIKYRFIGFYVFTFLVFLFYWYLNSAFCAVYEYTQSIFIVDHIICYVFALIYSAIIYFLPTGLRKISFISQKTKVFIIVYKISQFIPIF